MANLFDEDQGSLLRMNAIKYLEKPPEIQKDDDPFKVNGSLVMTFILVENVEQYKAGQGQKFQPNYVHQFFRSTNEIYGYKDLKITVHVTALGLKPFIQIHYSELTEDADDLQEGLNKLYEAGYLKTEEQFIETLQKEQEQEPIGQLIEAYDEFKIYQSTITETKGMAEFKPFVQAFLLLLIDGVQFPCDADNWVYYTVYKGKSFVGLTTIFKFNLSLNYQRYRLSQMLFLPFYQRKGHGSKMLNAIYKVALADEKCIQITLEDPSEDFQVMRDITDAKLLKQYFNDILPQSIINTPKEIIELKKENILEIIKKTKLHAQQIKRVYQIYQFAFVNKKSHQVMVEFGKNIMRELEKPYNRKKNILVKFEDGKAISAKQLHLLQMKEKEDRNINYEEALGEEFCLFELIATKLRKDGII